MEYSGFKIDTKLIEAFIMEHIGVDSDFRLLTRVCFPENYRDQVREEIKLLASNLNKNLTI